MALVSVGRFTKTLTWPLVEFNYKTNSPVTYVIFIVLLVKFRYIHGHFTGIYASVIYTIKNEMGT